VKLGETGRLSHGRIGEPQVWDSGHLCHVARQLQDRYRPLPVGVEDIEQSASRVPLPGVD